jgi:hypothetical protein
MIRPKCADSQFRLSPIDSFGNKAAHHSDKGRMRPHRLRANQVHPQLPRHILRLHIQIVEHFDMIRKES